MWLDTTEWLLNQKRNISCDFQDIGRPLFASFLHYIECKVFKDSVVMILISISECGFGYWIASQTKIILLGSMCFKCYNQVAKTLTIAQLPEHHSKQLIPAGELLHVAITIILANKVIELCSVQKSGKLSEYVFILVHKWSSV